LPRNNKYFLTVLQDTKACFFLGVCYERGIGVARDTDKAVEVYTIAADSGHADAQYNLAVLLGKQFI